MFFVKEINQSSQEEFIWAMRSSAYRELDEAGFWKSSTKAEVQDEEICIEEYQTKVMASLVPDEVIFNFKDYSQKNYESCILFGDVSGFTELCEKYSKTGQAGPSRLTGVLNKYLGTMVQEIMSYGGDILKFSGDAFLAWWKVTENEPMRDAVHECLDCALVIQKQYGTLLTDVGVTIRVKLAVSAGPVVYSLIGDQKNSHYVIVGKPIWDVKAGEAKSVAGDIILSPAAWRYTSANEYVVQEMADGIHMKVLGPGPNWRSIQKGDRHAKMNGDDGKSRDTDSLSSNERSMMAEVKNDEFVLRPAVNIASRLNIKEEIRKFIILPVMKSIDMNEPFEYLTEMRQVVIVFINIVSRKIVTKDYVQLANEAYKIVCSVVNEVKGCVNKVSLFDKDLMIVVVFGLRGLKHELECQLALKAAADCRQKINMLPKVYSTSIGITTGKTYCGVVGHTLRREYTVISLTVNKAARLMVNYKDRVSCDRETFLHSKMEARNFILQEYKKLKGISHPGPVYEFKEMFIAHDLNKISSFPILGRDEEVKLYLQLLNHWLSKRHSDKNTCKMYLIKGDARQGRTRLLEELIYNTPARIPVNRVTFAKNDANVPYQAVRLIFSLPLGMTVDSTTKQKEDKLRVSLRKMKVPELICVLNEVFAVHFKVTHLYTSLEETRRKAILKKMMKQLFYGCLLMDWIFALDNIEYVDELSWEALAPMFEIKMLFTVATIDRGKKMGPLAETILLDPKVKAVTLRGIDRWYHGGLACQILDVYALPPELEKAIQIKSNGNPGWIESFLVSLIQDDCLFILNTDMNHVNDLGLMIPPYYMMQRLTQEEVLEWKHVMEEKRLTNVSNKSDNWNKYVDTCRDKYLNVEMREKLESKLTKQPTVPACICSPKFSMTDVDPEISTDIIILKTFDSLTSYEQLFVKCSSILGNRFFRDMLLYVMSVSGDRELASAVQKLFEIKVLTCGNATLFEGSSTMMKATIIGVDDEEILPNCECLGVLISDACGDMPKYAFCNYMQYRSDQFREITYNLLTDSQRKEFHYRAIRYLEKETRRCRSCGNTFFANLLGEKSGDDFLGKVLKKTRKTSPSVSTDVTSVGTDRRMSVQEGGLKKLEVPSVADVTVLECEHVCSQTWPLNSQGRTTPSDSFLSVRNVLIRNGHSTQCIAQRLHARFGFTLINRLKDSYSLTRAFSSEDFTDCECAVILTSAYSQLIWHCKGAANWTKAVDAMIQYAEVCISTANVTLAIALLHEALHCIRSKSKHVVDTSWQETMIRGRVYILLGRCHMKLVDYKKALGIFSVALEQYKFKFPRESCAKHIERTNNWSDAECAAVMSLNKALQAFTDFKTICMAYSNSIEVARHFRKVKYSMALEVHALRICHLKIRNIDAEELKVVAKLYTIIFRCRFFRPRVQLDKCIHIGYIVLRIGVSVHAHSILLPLMPLLTRSLMLGKYISNTISILRELEYFSAGNSDASGRVWYYAMCLDFQLETGYTIVPYQRCLEYYQLEGENLLMIRDPDAAKRLYASSWLWCVRNKKWESVEVWSPKIQNFFIVEEHSTLSTKQTVLYIVEGMILCLVSEMDKLNVSAIDVIKREIERIFDALKKIYHLMAYYRFVTHNDHKVKTYLSKAKRFSVKTGNLLELSWLEHTQNAWALKLPPYYLERWQEHCEVENLLDPQELEINTNKLVHFTLPSPSDD